MSRRRRVAEVEPLAFARAAQSVGLPLRASARWKLNPPVHDVVADYLREHLPALAPTTQDSERSIIRRGLAALPDLPEPSDFVSYFRKMIEAGCEGSTANAHRKVWFSVYSFQARFRGFALNPLAEVSKVRERPPRPRAIGNPADTVPRLLAALDGRARALLLTLLGHGLRPGEGLGLELRHVDFSGQQIQIAQQRHSWSSQEAPLKHPSHHRRLPLDPVAAEALYALRDRPWTGRNAGETARRFLFPYFDRHLDPMMAGFRAIDPESFPEGNAWHAFRHTFATGLLDRGVRPREIQLLLGHATLRETHTYIGSLRGREDVTPADLAPYYAQRKEEDRALLLALRRCNRCEASPCRCATSSPSSTGASDVAGRAAATLATSTASSAAAGTVRSPRASGSACSSAAVGSSRASAGRASTSGKSADLTSGYGRPTKALGRATDAECAEVPRANVRPPSLRAPLSPGLCGKKERDRISALREGPQRAGSPSRHTSAIAPGLPFPPYPVTPAPAKAGRGRKRGRK